MGKSGIKFIDELLQKERRYWENKFIKESAAAGVVHDLSSNRSGEGPEAVLAFDLREEIEACLVARCGDNPTLTLTLLCGVVQICLHKYSGCEEIILASAIHEQFREVSRFNKVIGLKAAVNGDQTIEQVLLNAGEELRQSYAHQKYPFERLLALLKEKRGGDPLSLFRVAVVLQPINNPDNVRELKPDLTLSFSLREKKLTGQILYNSALYLPETILKFRDHLTEILTAVLQQPKARVSEIGLLTAQTRKSLIQDFNQTAAPFPSVQTLHGLFERQVALTPDRTAAVHEDHCITFEFLNRKADQLARRLIEGGLTEGGLVAVFLEHSLETLVAILATLKAGAAFIPLDPIHPPLRFSGIIQEIKPSFILTQRSLLPRLEIAALTDRENIICVEDHFRQPLSVDRRVLPAPTAGGDSAAYLLYTSGSTGSPKGALVSHRSIVNYICWARRQYFNEGVVESVPLYSSLAFDLTLTSVFCPLLGGDRIIIYSTGRPGQIAAEQVWEANQASVMKLTPSHLILLRERDYRRSGIRRLIVGGEDLSRQLSNQIREGFGGQVEIFNEYGPTEATVGCMIHRFDPVKDVRTRTPIGVPAANTRIYVLDQTLQPVAENMVGEIYIAGEGLALGYINKPVETALAFIPDPLAEREGGRMYRTGDLARFLPNGVLEYLGRRDRQVKHLGHRIELDEISQAINQHPQIRTSVVRAFDDNRNRRKIVAYYVSRRPLDPQELRAFLADRLIEQALPCAFVHLSKMPLTVNGKIAFGSLPGLEELPSEGKAAPQTPANLVEELLCLIWTETLGVEQLGVSDNFFALGGHSLLGAQLTSRIKETFGVDIPVRSLFEAPTIRELSIVIEGCLGQDAAGRSTPIKRVSRDQELPLSYAQQRMWILDRLEGGQNPAYNVPASVRLSGALNVEALRRTIAEVFRRHEVLRTSYPSRRGQPVQAIAETVENVLPLIDLSELPAEERDRRAQEMVTAEARSLFDLARGPLVRASLIRLEEQEHILLFTLHHIVCDGWSIGVLIKEVVALYQAYLEDRQSPLEDPPIQYADYAVWQREWLQGEILDKQLSYWKKRLGGDPPRVELPIDHPRPAIQSYRGAVRSFNLGEKLSQELKDLSRREGATLYMSLLAGLKSLLYRYSGQTDLMVGTPIANRNRVEAEALIGYFANTLVMRTDVGGNPSYSELLRRVRETALEAYAHQDLPFEKLVAELQTTRDLNQTPLFNVVFTLQNTPVQDLKLPGLVWHFVGNGGTTSKFELGMNFIDLGGELRGVIEYSTDLFEQETIDEMIQRYLNLLQSVVANPLIRLDELEILLPEEDYVLKQEILINDLMQGFAF